MKLLCVIAAAVAICLSAFAETGVLDRQITLQGETYQF
jgi:hypothetical protein